jgi:hypothetical protein
LYLHDTNSFAWPHERRLATASTDFNPFFVGSPVSVYRISTLFFA